MKYHIGQKVWVKFSDGDYPAVVASAERRFSCSVSGEPFMGYDVQGPALPQSFFGWAAHEDQLRPRDDDSDIPGSWSELRGIWKPRGVEA